MSPLVAESRIADLPFFAQGVVAVHRARDILKLIDRVQFYMPPCACSLPASRSSSHGRTSTSTSSISTTVNIAQKAGVARRLVHKQINIQQRQNPGPEGSWTGLAEGLGEPKTRAAPAAAVSRDNTMAA